MKTTYSLALTCCLAALAACSNNNTKAIDAPHRVDTMLDAVCSNCPVAPTLGTQIDRMGRPAINTALNHSFDGSGATALPAKDAYNADTDVTSWVSTYTAQFAANLAILDSLDTGICGNGLCETGESNTTCATDCPTASQTGSGNGCGNQLLYNGTGTGTAAATSYNTLAGILADDQLYVDTSKTSCTHYLAIEIGVVRSMPQTTCGGRAPTYDVMSFTLTALALGAGGFDFSGTTPVPGFSDGAVVHADVSNTTFPFLGAPH